MHTSITSADLMVRRAERADLPFVAWCNYEASSPYPGFCYWDPLLEATNTPTMAFIEAVFRTDALAWGRVEDFHVVTDDAGKPIAGASGFTMDADDYRPLRLDRLPLVAESLGWSAAALDGFLQGYQSVWADPHDPTLAPSASWIIECVAVIPEARGRGVAKRLMRALLAQGKAQGHTHAGISVTMGNDAAQRVYEAVGFRLYMSYGSAYFDDAFPGTIKYRARLTDAHASAEAKP
ncbi:MAG: GNAT family N-acetyltransferase [bacterium]|nr:GNAT family N-acetyltransferase [bacterium]